MYNEIFLILEFSAIGFPFAFGVFQDYYRTHEPFAGSSKIAVIGTTAMVINTPTLLLTHLIRLRKK